MDALFIFFIFFFLAAHTSLSQDCQTSSCHGVWTEVRFPFRLMKSGQPRRCGYPGFDLSCNNRSETVIHLPADGDFIVRHIDYVYQSIYLSDPDSCLPRRWMSLNLTGSPFRGSFLNSLTFLNCTSTSNFSYPAYPIPCLSGDNYTVAVVFTSRLGDAPPRSCRNVSTVLVPLIRDPYYSPMGSSFDLALTWDTPACGICEIDGRTCGFGGDTGTEIECFGRQSTGGNGLPRAAKYGIIMGAGIPGLLCLLCLVCYSGSKIRAYGRRHRINAELSTTVIIPRSVVVYGLDGPTIESYPKTVLGESRRLPRPQDGTCPICLADYLPKETIRTIPECNHFFHADCVDEWLKMNATCPLCRNSPDGSSAPSSSRLSSPPLSNSSSTSAPPSPSS